MSKRILIVSYLFAPNNAIGAIRPTKIADRLSRAGYEVDVFTYGYTANDGYELDNGKINIFRVNDKSVEPAKAAPAGAVPAAQSTSGLVYQIKRTRVTYNSRKRDAAFAAAFAAFYDKRIKEVEYDSIFTTFGPLASLEAGFYAKEKTPGINWICDFRDPVLVSVTPLPYRGSFKRIQNKACEKADKIVAVSNGYIKRICGEKYKDKAHMIPNGYELADKVQGTVSENDGKLHITYVGSLYMGKRDLTPVFRAIKELAGSGAVDINNIVFDYAGSDFAVLSMQAATVGMTELLHDNGRLSRSDCLNLQFKSDALVLSTWNDVGEEGVFPGKFLEYMLIGRPIIAVVDGSLANSEVKLVMDEGNFGVTYEAACKETDFEQLKAYIAAKYREKTALGAVSFAPSQDVLDRYNYDNIIVKIEELIG